jgi:hypothetical protein
MTRTTTHRPTSSINHHRTISTIAAAGLVGTLLAVTLGNASATPGRGDPPAAPAPAVLTHGDYVAHGCFMTPHTWSIELAGPLPVCYTYVP